MPYYSRPIGTEYPPVTFAFNKPIITGLLKEDLGFDHVLSGEALPARAWGVEDYRELEGLKASWMQAVTNSEAKFVLSSWSSSLRKAKSPWTVSRVDRPMTKSADVYLPDDH
jgi:hypothetical protein